jgi:hypothetical protein
MRVFGVLSGEFLQQFQQQQQRESEVTVVKIK